jgi:hypothetical protein
MQVLGAIAEFERARIVERVRAGLARARAQGRRLGRPRRPTKHEVPAGLTVRQAARMWRVSRATAARRLARGVFPNETNPSESGELSPRISWSKTASTAAQTNTCLSQSALSEVTGTIKLLS